LRNVTEDELQADHVICDIGTITRWSWSNLFPHVNRVFWHGPLGISEIDLFCEGSRFLASQLVSRSWPGVHRALLCGQSLITGLRRIGFQTERIRYLSSSGQAALHYFAGRPLPAVEVLNKAVEPRRDPYHVLIPLNGSEKDAFALHAAAATLPRDAEVFLLHVRSGLDEEDRPDFIAALTDAEKLQRRVESERIFAEANRILASRGLVASNQITAQGRPSVAISRYAIRTRAKLIVMADAHDVSVGATLIARSAVDDVEDAGGPRQRRVRRLLLPVDDSSTTMEAVGRLSELVDAENVEITLLYVQSEIEPRYEAERVFRTVQAALARQGLISHHQFTVEGRPANEILRCADDIGADLIVMGARVMSVLERILMGSVSHRVSKHARCPVLIVRIQSEDARKAA
jgi:nucleotide-binding universal stress UspA family protein